MKKGFISKSYALTVIFSLLLSISIASEGYAEINPGFNRYIGIPLAPEEQAAKEESQLLTATAVETSVVAAAALPGSEVELTPEIQELARALKNDPILIYEYVRNNIDYVPIFGSINGATGTLIAGRGSDYDQVSLFLALMKASGYTDYLYYYTSVTYPADKVASWVGVEKKAGPICGVFGSGGIGLNIDGLSCNGIDPEYVPSNVTVMHVYARVTIDGVYYYFDPSFKEYTYTAGINLSSAMGYDQTSFLNSALQGSTSTSDYIQNLNEGNIRNNLNTYSNNLVSYLKANKPNAYTKEIIGGQEIISQSFQSLDSFKTFPYPKTVYSSTSYVRDEHRHKLTISYRSISKPYPTYQIYGKRISIFHTGSGNAPELRIDGELQATGSSCTTGSIADATLSVTTPYGANDSGIFRLTCGYSYTVAHDFMGVSGGLIKKRNIELKKNRLSGLSDTSEPVLGESLNIMGLTWINEKRIEQDLAARLSEIVYIEHHTLGIVAQEAGYYIDVKVDTVGITSKNNDDAKEIAWFFTAGIMGSALEHGVIEQLQSNASTSTVKILQIANSEGQKIFGATSSNWSNITSDLLNGGYTQAQLDDLKQTYIDNGYTLTLPQNAKARLNQWEGLGYIAKKSDSTGISVGYVISGNFYGGYGSIPENYNIPTAQNQTTNYVMAVPQTDSFYGIPKSSYQPWSCDPVNMASGDYLFEGSDLSLGGGEPNGLNLVRSYNSGENLEKGPMGFGWRHNYEITLEKHSDGPNALGERNPVDTASAIAGLYAILDILYNNINNDRMMISALSSKWTVDRLIDNAVTIKVGNNSSEFIQLADASFNPPPGVSSELIKNGDNTYTLKERYGIELKFEPVPSDNTKWRISTWKDADANTMLFTYNTDGLQTVTDAFTRTLTFTYTNNLITSVSDSTGRSVSYGYTNDDLTSYTDPELKTWSYGYGYDTNHRMTSLTNPLSITTPTNEYDSLGRVKTQTFPRQGGGTATHNFYFSGFRNLEEDTEGKTIIYYFDDKGRLTAEENQLNYKTTYEYDGQNHQTKVTNPRNYFTTFQYDGNHNLTKITNALLKDTTNAYDSQFRLTDTIDPLNRGGHFDYDTEHHLTLSKSCSYSGTTCNPVIAGDGNEIKSSATYYANGLTQTATEVVSRLLCKFF